MLLVCVLLDMEYIGLVKLALPVIYLRAYKGTPSVQVSSIFLPHL
jgi:hypothetical protein